MKLVLKTPDIALNLLTLNIFSDMIGEKAFVVFDDEMNMTDEYRAVLNTYYPIAKQLSDKLKNKKIIVNADEVNNLICKRKDVYKLQETFCAIMPSIYDTQINYVYRILKMN